MDTQVHEIFGPPRRGPQRAPGGAKDLPKSSSGHKFYIFKLPINRKVVITRNNSPGLWPNGVIDQFLFFVLVCYPPLSPQGTSAPVPGRPGRSSGAPRALLGLGQGSQSPGEPPRGPQGPSRDAPGNPRDPPRAPKDPLLSPQDALEPT